ncbi:hypothetical protein LCGC14_2657940, partial [marine sediment metagenome]
MPVTATTIIERLVKRPPITCGWLEIGKGDKDKSNKIVK